MTRRNDSARSPLVALFVTGLFACGLDPQPLPPGGPLDLAGDNRGDTSSGAAPDPSYESDSKGSTDAGAALDSGTGPAPRLDAAVAVPVEPAPNDAGDDDAAADSAPDSAVLGEDAGASSPGCVRDGGASALGTEGG